MAPQTTGPDEPDLEVARASFRRFFAGVVMFSQAVADRVGIGPSDLHCLNVLNLSGPITSGQLSALTGLTSGAVTRLVDRLEDAGMVERDRDPDDRRRVIVKRSNRSGDEIQACFMVLGRRIGRLLGQLPPEERETVQRFLDDCNPLFLDAIAELRGQPQPRGAAGAGPS